MSKEMRQRSAEQIKKMRLEVLQSDDPEIWIEYDELSLEEWLGQTMSEIQDYINASSMMNADSLIFLRSYLPEFMWELHEDFDHEQFKLILDSADYAWRFDTLDTPPASIITAREIGRNIPRHLFYCSRKDAKHNFISSLRSIQPALLFVLKRDDEYIGTEIK